MSGVIAISGAREHNLKNISLKIPKNKLVMLTGVSGSGKSTIAFDIIFAEGQRRYTESLSSYARQFIGMHAKPNVEHISGLSPPIAISQAVVMNNPRSTAGTITEIYDHLRLLYSSIGIPHSPVTNLPLVSYTQMHMVEKILNLPAGSRIDLLAQVLHGENDDCSSVLTRVLKSGYSRVKVDGDMYEITSSFPKFDKNVPHNVHVVIDRLVVGQEIKQRLRESVEDAISISRHKRLDVEILEIPDNIHDYKPNTTLTFCNRLECEESELVMEKLEPKLFSFNNPHGACTRCNGLGKIRGINPDLIVPVASISISEGAIAPLGKLSNTTINNGALARHYTELISFLSQQYNFSFDTVWSEIPKLARDTIIYGTGDSKIKVRSRLAGGSRIEEERSYAGLIKDLSEQHKNLEGKHGKEYCDLIKCDKCDGHRLKQFSLHVKVCGLNIGELTSMSVDKSLEWFQHIHEKLTKQEWEISKNIIAEIIKKISVLRDVGLGYISLNRESGTLSGGECQRVRLASQIGLDMSDIIYILDEPSVGLHRCDNELLISTLKTLRDMGNSVIVVEHDEGIIESADFVIDIGPEAGVNGGEIMATGSVEEIKRNPKSLTGMYISGAMSIESTKPRPISKNKIVVTGAYANNLKNVNVSFPTGNFICVTGVSGSGKSSLVIDVLCKHALKVVNGCHLNDVECQRITGLEMVEKVVEIDQSPIGKTSLSNPATYTGIFSHIRDWFANLSESKSRGYKVNKFSFNTSGGRCENCKGDGYTRFEMHFLPDVYVKCEQCNGRRYKDEVMEIKYRGCSIADVLDMKVDDALVYFDNIPVIKEKLMVLKSVGLGYISLGQSSNTLSGGESQRIRLSKELSKKATGKTLYILDEPTSGLHLHDIKNLLSVLHKLVDKSNTVIVIEHNLNVIKVADYVIDMGPTGGENGGYVLAEGTPLELTKIANSITGRYLKDCVVESNFNTKLQGAC